MNIREQIATISLFYGQPMSVVSDCLRGFLVSDEGYDLIGCDFSSIEARVLAWLADEKSTLEVFKGHGRIYEMAATSVYGCDLSAVTKEMRPVGKVAVLAFGFGGGVMAYLKMAKTYSVDMELAFEGIWSRASSDLRERALSAWAKTKLEDVSEKAFIACEITKIKWREANPNIVQYWYDLERAAINAVRDPGKQFEVGRDNRRVFYKKAGSFLFCKLPSSRVITYPYPEIKDVDTPWGEKKLGLTYMGEDSNTHEWCRQKAYGGLLAENNTQGVARDLLAEAMLRLEKKNYPIVFHVHDEVECEVPKGFGSVHEVESTMCEPTAWSEGLPIAAEGWRDKRYRK